MANMINLVNLQPSTISRNLKGKFLLIYGLPKVGKTTFASEIPGHLICSFEPGTNALVGKMIVPMTKWTDFKQVISQLRQPAVQDKFDVICIDTADKSYEMCEKYICQQNGIAQLGDMPYGKAYDLCKKEFSSCLEEIAKLGYGLCFISHSTEKKFKDENGEEYISLAPALPTRPYDIINKLVDIIGYIRVKKNESGDSIGRIYFRGDDNFLAGSRFKYIDESVLLSKNRDFYYKNVEDAILRAIFKKEEQLDFHELMNEARNLWSEKVGNDTKKAQEILSIVEKIFGKPMKISDVTPDQVDLLAVLVTEMKNI